MIGQLRWLDVLAKFFHLAPQQQTNKQTNTIRTRPLAIHPSSLSEIGQKGIYICIIDLTLRKLIFVAETKRKIKSRIAHSSQQSAEHRRLHFSEQNEANAGVGAGVGVG